MAKSDKSKSKKEPEEIVDLSVYAKALSDYLKNCLKRFAKDQPDVKVSCVALYFTNYGSSVYINYETQAHSDEWVDENRGTDEEAFSIRQDAGGYFNPFPNDFEYGQHDEFEFEGLPDFHAVTWPVKFRGLDGKVEDVDSDDESVGRVLLKSFEPALKSFDAFGPLKRSKPFRMGICVHNTECESFWLHPPAKTNGRNAA